MSTLLFVSDLSIKYKKAESCALRTATLGEKGGDYNRNKNCMETKQAHYWLTLA